MGYIPENKDRFRAYVKTNGKEAIGSPFDVIKVHNTYIEAKDKDFNLRILPMADFDFVKFE